MSKQTRLDEWANGWMNKSMNMKKYLNQSTNKWMKVSTIDKWTEQINESKYVHEWINEGTDKRTNWINKCMTKLINKNGWMN